MTTLHVLIDNTAHMPDLASEHGLSMALESPEGLWLWDTGASEAFVENAARLGLALNKVVGVALSHGHWDHTGGLPALRLAGNKAPVFAHPDVLVRRFMEYPKRPPKEIGWRGGREQERLHPVTPHAQLTKKMQLHTAIPRQTGLFQAVEHFFLDQECTQPDYVVDDAALLVEGSRGPAVILGCCHSGLANTLHALRARAGLDQVHTVVGGLHLMHAPQSAVRETLEVLREFGVRRVFAGHCTGKEALERLRRELPDVVHGLGGGRRIQL